MRERERPVNHEQRRQPWQLPSHCAVRGAVLSIFHRLLHRQRAALENQNNEKNEQREEQAVSEALQHVAPMLQQVKMLMLAGLRAYSSFKWKELGLSREFGQFLRYTPLRDNKELQVWKRRGTSFIQLAKTKRLTRRHMNGYTYLFIRDLESALGIVLEFLLRFWKWLALFREKHF